MNFLADHIDAVLYINLQHREDRRKLVEEELLRVFPKEKIIRIDAVLDTEYGGKGCTRSHMKALTFAIDKQYKNCLIVEDDFIWNETDSNKTLIPILLSKNYDVILFGSAFLKYDTKTYKVQSSQTRTGYLVNAHYYKKLFSNFKESLDEFEKTNKYCVCAGDQWWKRIQQPDNWYAFVPVLCYQRPGYSDIQKKQQSYIDYSITK